MMRVTGCRSGQWMRRRGAVAEDGGLGIIVGWMMGWDTAFSPGRSPSPSPLSNSSPLRQTLSASPAAEATEAKRLRRWPWPRRHRCRGGRGRGRRRTQSFQRPPKEMARTRRVSEQRRMERGREGRGGGREERKENNGSRSLAKRRRVSILMILACDWGRGCIGRICTSTF